MDKIIISKIYQCRKSAFIHDFILVFYPLINFLKYKSTSCRYFIFCFAIVQDIFEFGARDPKGHDAEENLKISWKIT